MHPGRRWLVFLSAAIAVLAAVLAVVLPVVPASASAGPAAGTRVGASHPEMIFAVGASRAVSAGEGRCGPASQAGFAVGACVAAEDTTDLSDAATCGGMSFTGTTKVLLASGAAIPISQLKPGEKVLATNTKTGKTSPQTVTAVLLHHDTDRYDLTVKVHNRTAVIQTTSSHLFWNATSHRWVKAAALKYGTHLRTASSPSVTVLGGSEPSAASGWMWDLTVTSDHDFYVDTAAATVLVHNCSGTPDFNDPSESPGPGWEWRGSGDPASGKGSWYNPETGESLHPDLGHPDPIGPHYDWRSPDGTYYRIYPDGRVEPK